MHKNLYVILALATLAMSSITMGAQDRIMPEKKTMQVVTGAPSIIIIGASYAKGWTVERLAGLPVLNRGVGGEETADVLARFKKDVVNQKPSNVIIWGFINDIFRSSHDGLPARKEAIKNNIAQMVDLARSGGVRPILATEVTMGSGKDSMKEILMAWVGKLIGKRSYADHINGHVQQVNDWMREYAATNGIVLLDLQAALAEPSGLRKREYTQEDGSHLTPAAYDALTRYADPELARLFMSANVQEPIRR